ncbi:MAG: VCBS repeat-containing protein [Sandaracinaceae bacterium]|nr:VCBS repeat-containing protein [Sandaracinaceae bacterium]
MLAVRVSLFAVALALSAGCDCSASPPVGACSTDSDCAPGQVCRDGACVARPGMDAAAPEDAGLPRLDAPTADSGPGCPSMVICGTPPACCGAGEECVEGACLTACESGVRCGADRATCCASGQVCVSSACVDPGGACTDSFECPIGEFCEPTLGRCLRQFDPVACTFRPVFGEFEAVLEWSVTSATRLPECMHPISAPVVVDLDGDDVPEVIANFTCSAWDVGALRAYAGDGSTERWVVESPRAYARTGIAAGDLDGDGRPEIVAVGQPSGGTSRMFAVNADGTLLWQASTADGSAEHRVNPNNGAPTIADLDGDGRAEVLFGAVVYDADGRLLWQRDLGAREGSNAGYLGGITAVADLTGDGVPEVITGRRAYRNDGTPLWEATAVPAADGGYPAIGQFDADPQPEVALVAGGAIYILDGLTGAVEWGPHLLPITPGQPRGRGGPPTIADFDADGRPEIGVAGASAYAVFDPDGPTPVLWWRATEDFSSNATGSSVFDFEGDGTAEVVYGDECFVRVYRGTDGAVLLEIPNSTATIHEYPLVADVDGDGRSEIVVVANDLAASVRTQCGARSGWTAAGGARGGLFVYGDARNQWMRTRRVWNQHAYHVTNVTSIAGRVPIAEVDNWSVPGLNNYRQNVQGEGVFNAPDLVVLALEVLLDGCPARATLRARVANEGSIGVPAGVPVAFRTGTIAAPGALLGVAPTTVPLLPGASTVVVLADVALAGDPPYAFVATVDDDGTGASIVLECDDDNNAAAIADLTCDILL